MVDDTLLWARGELGEGLERLAERLGAPPRSAAPGFDGSVVACASACGLEAVAVSRGERARTFAELGSGVIKLGEKFLVVLRSRRRHVTVLRPRGGLARVPVETLVAIERGRDPTIEAGVRSALSGVPSSRRRPIANVLFTLLIDESEGEDLVWVIRLPMSAPFRALLRELGATSRLVLFVLASAVQFVALAASWRIIGGASLTTWGADEVLTPWVLTIATMNFVGLVAIWSAGSLAIDVGTIIKRRLLFGALALELDAIKLDGVGHFMAMAIEAEAVENAAIAGGFSSVLGLLNLLVSGGVLYMTIGLPALALLALWVAVIGALMVRYYRLRRAWTLQRRARSNDLAERMAGQRTLVAQTDLEWLAAEDDRNMSEYLRSSGAVDSAEALLQALTMRGWPMIGGILVLSAITTGVQGPLLAAAIGGVLLAGSAVQLINTGLSALVGASISIELIRPLFTAATRGVEARSAPKMVDGATLLAAKDLTFGYKAEVEPILKSLDLEIRAGERVLLEGLSGTGKSTLVALLTAQRLSCAGELRLGGRTVEELGPREWRRHVVSVPQFHDNHVFSSSFAFNILMGRDWPPTQKRGHFRVVEKIIAELDLTSLVRRMPSGVWQLVGETGWQLSHGEKSRLYIARALAQEAKILVLDESLAAIDPLTTRQILAALDRREVAVILIAHP
jgi:ATP-binding cassette subfamily B protein